MRQRRDEELVNDEARVVEGLTAALELRRNDRCGLREEGTMLEAERLLARRSNFARWRVDLTARSNDAGTCPPPAAGTG